MALNDILRKAVGIIDKQTKSMQGPVVHKQISGQDDYGERVFSPASGTIRQALINQEQGFVKQPDGTRVPTMASLTFVQEFGSPLVSGIDRAGPVDPRDEFLLPDGTTGPVVRVTGPYNPGTGAPFVIQVWLGER